jgi:hypothetical protein
MTSDKALISEKDAVASPASTSASTEHDNTHTAQSASSSVSSVAVQIQTTPEKPSATRSNNISSKNDLNRRHPKHTRRVNDDSLSRGNQVDNISHAMSAPMSVLGANSDRFDFFRGGGNSTTSNHYNSTPNDKETSTNTTLGKAKSWFVDTSDNTAHDYREFSTPSGHDKQQKQKKTIDEFIDGDVELASNTTNNNNNNRRKQQYVDDEECVVKTCSFAYGSPEKKHKLLHKIVNDENYNHRGIDEEENQEYFSIDYRNRRINPHAMAHAITSRARRTWTERRYRRRLRQSEFIPPSNNTASENGDDINSNTHSYSPIEAPSSFHYELTPEHRYAFLAAHAALNGRLANEQYRNRREDDFDHDLQFDLGHVNDSDEEVRADLTNSSLAIRGGLIRLPVDNVRLVCDEHLQPGILSIETRDMGSENGGGGTKGYEMFGNANRYGNIHGNMMIGSIGGGGGSKDRRQRSERIVEHWKRHELAYVLTVDEHIYQRVAQEMGDANRVPYGIYFCCHETEGGSNHVGIEVAVLILLIIVILLVAGMIAWPTW